MCRCSKPPFGKWRAFAKVVRYFASHIKRVLVSSNSFSTVSNQGILLTVQMSVVQASRGSKVGRTKHSEEPQGQEDDNNLEVTVCNGKHIQIDLSMCRLLYCMNQMLN